MVYYKILNSSLCYRVAPYCLSILCMSASDDPKLPILPSPRHPQVCCVFVPQIHAFVLYFRVFLIVNLGPGVQATCVWPRVVQKERRVPRPERTQALHWGGEDFLLSLGPK